jgi:uncharacterized protein YfbU (UPF0304 family)
MATERFEMRVDSELLERLDVWRASEDDTPSRAEAVRRLMEMGLGSESKYRPTDLSDGEKLITMMLAGLIKATGAEVETNVDLVEKVIVGGHYWALDWEMPGIFHSHRDKRSRVSFVVDVLDMWDFLEEAYEKLSDEDKERLAVVAEPFGKYVKFAGFDGNNETEHMGIAMFLIRDLNRFTRFKDYNMNSHAPTVERYGKMYRAFEPIRKTLVFGKAMSVEQMATVLNARKAG